MHFVGQRTYYKKLNRLSGSMAVLIFRSLSIENTANKHRKEFWSGQEADDKVSHKKKQLRRFRGQFVGMTGFEPTASSFQPKRATGLRYFPKKISGVIVPVQKGLSKSMPKPAASGMASLPFS